MLKILRIGCENYESFEIEFFIEDENGFDLLSKVFWDMCTSHFCGFDEDPIYEEGTLISIGRVCIMKYSRASNSVKFIEV